MYSLSFLKSFFVHQRMLLRQLSMKLQRTPVLRNRCKHCFQIHRSQPVPVEKSQKICLLFLRKVMHHEHFVRKIAAKIKLRRRREASQSKKISQWMKIIRYRNCFAGNPCNIKISADLPGSFIFFKVIH